MVSVLVLTPQVKKNMLHALLDLRQVRYALFVGKCRGCKYVSREKGTRYMPIERLRPSSFQDSTQSSSHSMVNSSSGYTVDSSAV
jgi:hypothetical protein